MDGRDVPPESGKGYIHALQNELKALGCGKIATVMGRYYAMDRDNRFERVEKHMRRSFMAKAFKRRIPRRQCKPPTMRV